MGNILVSVDEKDRLPVSVQSTSYSALLHNEKKLPPFENNCLEKLLQFFPIFQRTSSIID